MRKFILVFILCMGYQATINAQMGMLAIWTGKYEQAESVLGNLGNNCEYLVNGKKFWKFFAMSQGFCPTSIYVQ